MNQIEALEKRLDRAETLINTKLHDMEQALRALKRGTCWCDMAIGNPMMNGHSVACMLARKVLDES